MIIKEKLDTSSSLDKYESLLSAGHILFVDTATYFDHFQDDIHMLKKTIDELKRLVLRKGGNIARIGDSILVLTPNNQFHLF